MAEYMRKDVFLSSMGLTGDETKYGNHDAEHQQRSYSTYMSYEIIDSVEDSIVEEELAPVRHGRWEMNSDRPDTIICSNCLAGFDVWKHEAKDFNFCPNCGARMDLEE